MLQACGPGAVQWIERTMGDCVYSRRDMLGFGCGMVSICCWMVAQVPQLWRNYRNKSAEALSPYFLAEWLLGDTFNLLGALLKGDQLPTVVFTAQYFICMDAVMMVQWLYYSSLQRRRERLAAARRHRLHHRHHSHHHGSGHRRHSAAQHQHGSGDERAAEQQQQHSGGDWQEQGPLAGDPVAVLVSSSGSGAEIRPGSAVVAAAAAEAGSSGARAVPVVPASGRDVSFRPQRLLAAGLGALLVVAYLPSPWRQPAAWQQLGGGGQQQQQAGGQPALQRRLLAVTAAGGLAGHMPAWSYTAGSVLGYCSSALYLTSRLSQIWRNHRRRSAEGLAISMFLCAIAANTLYGASILLRSYSWPELRSSLPWLIGSLGTVAMDAAIFAQYRLLGGGDKQHPSDEDEPLLAP